MLTGGAAILPVTPENIPAELKALPQWVLWRAETRKDKLAKVPYQTNGQRAKSDAPQTWASFGEVWGCYEDGKADGIGFVFAHGGGLVGVDLDDCFVEAGKPHPRAAAIVRALDSYTECSVSGGGLHAIVRASLDKGRRRGPLELYPHGRFFTVTGCVWGENREVRDAQTEIDRIVKALSPQRNAGTFTTGRRYLGNAELIERARAAKNGAKFAHLWDGNTADYPSPSEADLALMCLLLFWTNGDADRAEALFSDSALAQRSKWADRADYRRRTLQSARECLKGGGAYGVQ